MTSLTIVLPLPPLGCSPNGSHGHWSSAGRARKEYRETAFAIAYKAKPNGWDAERRFRVSTEWYMGLDKIELALGEKRLYRPIDEDNAVTALKGAMDGLRDAGVIFNDSSKWLTRGETVLNRTQKAHGGRSGVVVTLEVIGSE